MSDLISRQAAIDVARECPVKEVTPAYMLIDKAEVMTELMMLPSEQSEPCLDSIVSEIKKTISETKESGKYHCDNIRINGEMICFGLQLALQIIEEKRNGQSDKQTGGD